MSERLTRALAAHTARLKRAAGVSVTYVRGAERLQLTAVEGRTVYRRDPQREPTGASIVFGDRDYLIEAADLVIGGAAVEPERGDRIVATVAGRRVVFELVAPEGEPAWRWSDPQRSVYRVHVKEA